MFKYLTCILFAIILIFNKVKSQNIAIADSLLQIYNLDQNKIDDSVKLNLLAEIAYYHPAQDSVINYSKKLIQLAEETQHLKFISKGYYYLGQAFRKKGLLDEALHYFLLSATHADSIKDYRAKGIALMAMGDVHSSAQNHSNSINSYNEAITIFTYLKDSLALGTAFLNIGSEYSYSKHPDTAYIYINKSLTIFKSLHYQIGVAYCKSNLGKLLQEQNNLDIAETYIKEAIEILADFEDTYSLAINKRYLALIALNKLDYSKAIRFANESLNLSIRNGLIAQERDAHEVLRSIYKETKNYRKAFYHQSKFIELNDSIVNKETIQKMADLRTEYEVAQKQAEVEKAEAQLALVEKKKEIQQIIGIGLIGGLLLVAVLATVLYRNAKRSRKTTQILRNQKEELQIQHDQLKQLNKTKDRFFSIISHDLRGPIGVLNGTTLLIKEYLESENYSQMDELISNMELSLDKVQKLLNNLLEWAISQQGKYNYTPEPVNINLLALDTISIFDGMARAKNITLGFEQKHTDIFLNADRNSISTILRNLISNAIKFTNPYGNIDVIVEKDGEQCKISIRDNGVGISKDRLATLFKIETRKSTWGTNREKGLGIGLNLAYEFVKMNKGKIYVFSTLGIGTTFEIIFPIYSEKTELNNVMLV